MTSEDYKWYKGIGICVRCRKAKAAKGKTRCLNCLDIEAAYMDAYRRRNPEKAKASLDRRRERARERKAYRKEMGICIDCTKPAKYGYLCYEHYIKRKRDSARRYQKWKLKQSSEVSGQKINFNGVQWDKEKEFGYAERNDAYEQV